MIVVWKKYYKYILQVKALMQKANTVGIKSYC